MGSKRILNIGAFSKSPRIFELHLIVASPTLEWKASRVRVAMTVDQEKDLSVSEDKSGHEPAEDALIDEVAAVRHAAAEEQRSESQEERVDASAGSVTSSEGAKNSKTAKWAATATQKYQTAVVGARKLYHLGRSWLLQTIRDSEVIRERLKDLALTNYRLGVKHFRDGDLSDAAFRFRLVAKFKPESYPESFFYLARILLLRSQKSADKEKAVELYKKALELKPDYPEAVYYLGRLQHPESVRTVPSSIIKEAFNQLAPHYEEFYVRNLQYKGHSRAFRFVQDFLLEKGGNDQNHRLTMLDLGCGTGLCGYLMVSNQLIRNITGVDIAAAMIAEAHNLIFQKQPVYDHIIEEEVHKFLEQNDVSYDVIVAAGLCNYIGDIAALLKQIALRLKPEGIAVISVEKSAGPDISLHKEYDSFSHSLVYIEQVVAGAGLQIKRQELFDMYKGVKGYQLLLQKP